MTRIPGLHATGREPKDVKIRIFSNPKLPDHQQEDGSKTLTFNTDQDLEGVRDSLEDMINRFGPAYSDELDWVSQPHLITETDTSQVTAFDLILKEIQSIRDQLELSDGTPALDKLERRVQNKLKTEVDRLTSADE